MAKPVYLHGVKVQVLPPYMPKVRTQFKSYGLALGDAPSVVGENPGWLYLWFSGGENTNPPNRKIRCDRREVRKAVEYWDMHVVGDIRHEFVPVLSCSLDGCVV